ncbi:MAG TPA: N-6 DNA methylase [Bacteroidales bacterium]|jgi:SAM-dependent methyltransferase|nr:MAG: Restriction enzyme BgcI subunit alpha [Bacteroidetes bacterium ADurb.Bin012]HNQ59506.1 N-6 DNA methylase [Bacteroidales bacterium]HNU21164.1 N-6 DNA methylase [Bacteroidales bacterium]HNV16636.1 N-6 DNA methylase [Bacteroidales bacterium]HOC15234.1 N-6 DNA methylase [Bacteroidales bacterium]
MNDKEILIQLYYQKIKASSKELTKKEAFKDLLNRLYSSDKEIRSIIDRITLGAETTVVNIPKKDKLHRGSADTLYNNIIIEFENDLKVSYQHAKEQLAGYLLGQFRSGKGYNFTLIVSDFINWKVLAPDISCLDKLDDLHENELILNEIKSASFVLDESNAEEFYYWIDRFLFKEEKQKATLKSIEESFGYQSSVFIESFRELNNWFNEAKKYGIVQVSFEQWYKFLSIAYGSFDGSESIFLIHTYLSIFAKMLAYAVVSNDDYISDDEMREILNGSIFQSYNISNFVDNDFFHWVNGDRDYLKLKNVFRLIAQEISTFNFSNVDEDILKGVYQELIDIDTRHSLGEYYTPDWLCERIVNEYEFKKTDRILDPACGSGSFLRAFIHRIRELNPDATAEEINNQIYGIDIHPLSVQIAKTTLLLALGKGISRARRPIHLNIILANTLLAPEGVQNAFGNDFVMQIDKDKYIINTQIFDNVEVFDAFLDICEELSEQTLNKKDIELSLFEDILKHHTNGGLCSQLVESFYKIYQGVKRVKEKGRNGIWKFILSNLYKPFFLANRFDYVIGNPPWFTYSSIKNKEYQDLLDELAVKYNVKPQKVANYPHLEIAAIFQSYCSSYFLNDWGKQAFVLPRSFFSADHHENSRSGIAKGFRLSSIWDLDNVSPLFRIPCCVFFSEKKQKERIMMSSGLDGKIFVGKLPTHNCNYAIAKNILVETPVKWYYIRQGQSSALSTRKIEMQRNVNPYKNLFKQGATIVPRAFYFVELDQQMPDDFNDRIISLRTSKFVKADSKDPWKLEFSGRMESRFLFRTAISKSILPFHLYKPDFVVLPLIIQINENQFKKIEIHTADDIMNMGYLNASRWFRNAERIWNINKTEKSKNMSTIGRLNFHNGLTQQNLNAEYLVLYNSSAKDANALVVNRSSLDLEFICESKSYVYYLNNENEAYYLTALLNSSVPNFLMKDFQTKGLFGPRDIHKKILNIYFPKFDENNKLHLSLAALSKSCHDKTEKYVETNPPNSELTPIKLGKYRVDIKRHLSKEMADIDKIVRKIIKE